MTDIQVKYWDLQENKRHNLAYETETNRHNVVGEQQNAIMLGENIRHNKATESETHRANLRNEELGFATLREAKRHNTATEGIQRLQAASSAEQARAATRNADIQASLASSVRMRNNSAATLDTYRAQNQKTANQIQQPYAEGAKQTAYYGGFWSGISGIYNSLYQAASGIVSAASSTGK